jgi:lipoate-protein ligase A
MKWIDLSLPTPEENLACDEALLDLCEDEGREGEVLRLWETRQPFVVLGHANRTRDEVHVDACRRNGIPILRRASGGGAVLQGPGNAQYRRRHHILFHGTFLFDLDIELVERTLTLPARQPAYRQGRPHRDFLANIGGPARAIKETLRMSWQAHDELIDVPFERIASLRDRYASAAWNFKF